MTTYKTARPSHTQKSHRCGDPRSSSWIAKMKNDNNKEKKKSISCSISITANIEFIILELIISLTPVLSSTRFRKEYVWCIFKQWYSTNDIFPWYRAAHKPLCESFVCLFKYSFPYFSLFIYSHFRICIFAVIIITDRSKCDLHPPCQVLFFTTDYLFMSDPHLHRHIIWSVTRM